MNEYPEKIMFKGTSDTPEVILDKDEGIYKITGISLPTNIFDFYNPIVNWILNYSKEPNEETKFEFKFSYLNSSSAKLISDIMSILKNIHEQNKKLKITWRYNHDDEEIKEMGMDFASALKLPVELIDDGI